VRTYATSRCRMTDGVAGRLPEVGLVTVSPVVVELVSAEGTSHNAYALVRTQELAMELHARGREIDRYGKLTEPRGDGRIAVKVSPEARNYLEGIGSGSRLRLLARAMPWVRATGRPRIETHHFAMALLGNDRLETKALRPSTNGTRETASGHNRGSRRGSSFRAKTTRRSRRVNARPRRH
jgi:hypothetical protein